MNAYSLKKAAIVATTISAKTARTTGRAMGAGP